MVDKNPKKRWSVKAWIAIIIWLLLLFANIYQFTIYAYPQIQVARQEKLDSSNVDATIQSIQSYLDQISPDFIEEVQNLAQQYGVPSWGCGPSSYALAQIINKKFFGNKVKITASYDAAPIEIVERFAFADSNGDDPAFAVVDHAWLEIYMKNKILFIDPTIGQFGKINKIAYHEFDFGDDNISKYLLDNYGIYDIRFSILMQKVLNRIPKDQPPYPGATIQQSSIAYYTEVLNDRNELAAGKEPDNWKDWVNQLESKF